MPAKNEINWIGFLGICLIAFPAFLDFTIVYTALPEIQRYFTASVLSLQWVTNIFAMVLAGVMIVAGRLADILGRRGVAYFGAGIFAIGALGGGFASSIEWLIVFRAILGIGAAFVFITPLSLIPQAVGEEHQQKCIGIYSAITGLGMAIGPFLGGILVQYLSWRWVMWINLPFLILGVALCMATIRGASVKMKDVRIDLFAVAMLLASIILFVNGIINISHAGFAHWTSAGLIILAIVIMGALIYRERHDEHPMLDLSIFKNPHLLLAIFTIIAGAIASYALFFYDPLYLSVIFQMDAIYLGLMLLAMPIGQVLFSLISGPLIKKIGLGRILLLAIFATVVASLGHAFFSVSTPYWFAVVIFFLLGLTIGAANVGLASAAYGQVPEEKIGGVIGTMGTIWNLSGSVVLAIATVLFYKGSHSSMSVYVKSLGAQLNAPQNAAIEAVIHTPTKSSLLSQAFNGKLLESLLTHLKDAFLAGLHSLAWVYFVVSLVLFVIGFLAYHSAKNKDKKNNLSKT